ncbi:MAG: class I SAM-dependent methyltransferase [Dorea sp.]|nr:class I SAM-dependent methyltransferase [Dorea sp.]
MTSEKRLREMPGAMVKWYDFEKGSRIAVVVHECGNSLLIAKALEEEREGVERILLDRVEGAKCHEEDKEIYDVIIAADVLEYTQNIPGLLKRLRAMLKPDGKLLLATDNRLGIRYFCGDQDLFTGKNYDGIENYKHLLPWERKAMNGKAYSKAELTRFLETAGFGRHRFFSVFPRISNPQILLAEDYEPNEALDIRVFPEYNNPDTVFLFEEELYPSLMENQLLHPMANGFFIECPLSSCYTQVNQVTLSGERGKENAMATVIRGDGLVEKRALYPEGRIKLERLLENHEYLSAHGVRMIDMELKEDSLVMPYVPGIPATDYFRNLLKLNQEFFLSRLDAFWDIVLGSGTPASFDEIDWERFEPGGEKEKMDSRDQDKWKRIASGPEKEDLGVILKRGYLDLVSLNCFYFEGEFVFYDQELYLENVPAKAIMFRTVEFIYKFHDYLDGIFPREMLFERYGLVKYRDLYGKFISAFLNELRRDDDLSNYVQKGRRKYETVLKNRGRMNYSEEEYTMIFKDIFRHMKGRRLYLFGSGKYAQKFRERYEKVYPVTGYLDNDKSRWGTQVDGVLVSAPVILKEMAPKEYKVIVCIRDCMPVVKQLREMGIGNFSVYNPDADEAFVS